jgi:uncharacterized membrane protein
MDDSVTLPLFTLTRIAHVYTAIVLAGGTVFVRFVLMPAATAVLSDEVHAQLRSRVMATWRMIVHGGIALLLVSGFVNFFRDISAGTHQGDKLYHPLIGTKILLALAVFFIASALVGKSAKFEGMRRDARKWLTVLVLLTAAIVCISGFLKVRGGKPASLAAAVQSID